MKSKPRKQTYTLEMFLKNMNEQDIRSDQDVQRLSDQWSNNMMNELIVTILMVIIFHQLFWQPNLIHRCGLWTGYSAAPF